MEKDITFFLLSELLWWTFNQAVQPARAKLEPASPIKIVKLYLSLSLYSLSLRERERAETIITFHHPPATLQTF